MGKKGLELNEKFFNQETELSDILFVLYKHRFLTLTLVVIGVITGMGFALFTKKKYEGKALVAITSTRLEPTGPLSMVTGLVGKKDQETLQLLNSHQFAIQFASEVLLPDLVKIPNYREVTLDLGVSLLKSIRSIKYDTKTGIISVFFRWEDPKLVAKWANEYVSTFNRVARFKEKQENEKALYYLNQELNKTHFIAVKEAAAHLTEIKLKESMAINVQEEYVLKVIDPAFEPKEPDSKKIYWGAAFASLGFVLSLLWILWKEFISKELNEVKKRMSAL
ncbi:MAG: hypothetical protein A2007_04335 [Verrucomicrobia bacterium GWC2_42_7]|nr:MAG: hypothetical protein A2007_04335 [Verrucomicrobia bacterium GWC2_42_7]